MRRIVELFKILVNVIANPKGVCEALNRANTYEDVEAYMNGGGRE